MKKTRARVLPRDIVTAPDSKPAKNLKATLCIAVSLFAFLLYSNTISHHYTLDDHPAIDQNRVTTQGIAGIPTLLKTDYWFGYGTGELRGPVYRPTSLITFALVWQFFPDNPHIYHFINVLFYALTCLTLFLVLCSLFKNYSLAVPLVSALLYAAHPIHTEVVNNIKTLDDIYCFLFGILSIGMFLKYNTANKQIALILAGFSFFLSLLSKETGITFLAVIPLVLYFFTDMKPKKLLLTSVSLLSISIMWLLWRAVIFEDLVRDAGVSSSPLNNVLNAAPGFFERMPTVFYVLLRYVGLLIFPHPLTSDYNFAQIKIQSLSDPGALIGLVVCFGLGIYALLNFRKKSIPAFGILFFFITVAPVSNFFFIGGSTMAERFMYIPSLGFCIVFACLLAKLAKAGSKRNNDYTLRVFFKSNSKLFILTSAIIALYSIKAFTRNQDWKNNLTVFSKDVRTSSNSATAHFIYGSSLLEELYPAVTGKDRQDSVLSLSIRELNKGLSILNTMNITAPVYNFKLGAAYIYNRDFQNALPHLEKYKNIHPNPVIEVYINLGIVYYNLKMFDKAIEAEDSVIKYLPNYAGAYITKGLALAGKQEYDKAILQFQKTIALEPENEEAYTQRALVYSKLNMQNEALGDFTRAVELNPGNSTTYFYRGNFFSGQKKYDEAIKDYNEAINRNSEYAEAFIGRAFAYYFSGNNSSACRDFQKAASLEDQSAKTFYQQFCR